MNLLEIFLVLIFVSVPIVAGYYVQYEWPNAPQMEYEWPNSPQMEMNNGFRFLNFFSKKRPQNSFWSSPKKNPSPTLWGWGRKKVKPLNNFFSGKSSLSNSNTKGWNVPKKLNSFDALSSDHIRKFGCSNCFFKNVLKNPSIQ